MVFQKGKKSELLDALGSVGMLGTHLVGCTIVGGVMGYFLDDWLGTKPWFILSMTILGIIAGFKNLIHVVAYMQRKEKKEQSGHDFGSKT